MKKFSLVDLWCSRLTILDTHPALYLVRCSFSAPRLLYISRCSDVVTFREIFEQIDERVRRCLCSILDLSLTDFAWRQAYLPVSHGGLGLGSISDLATSAHLGSLCRFKSLAATFSPVGVAAHLEERTERHSQLFRDRWGDFPVEDPEANRAESPAEHPKDISQASLTAIVSRSRRSELLDRATGDLDLARLNSASHPVSGKWLFALPSPPIGTMLDNNSLRIAVGLRLGMAICAPHVCARCTAQVSATGEHGLSCSRSSGRLSRHRAINKLLSCALHSAKIANDV